jgi:hypothetical protein
MLLMFNLIEVLFRKGLMDHKLIQSILPYENERVIVSINDESKYNAPEPIRDWVKTLLRKTKMDPMLKMMVTLRAGKADRKIEAAGISDADMAAMMGKLAPVPQTVVEQINAFKEELGEETFKTLAAGSGFDKVLEKWLVEKGKKNMENLFAMLKERVPDLEEEELTALLAIASGADKPPVGEVEY